LGLCGLRFTGQAQSVWIQGQVTDSLSRKPLASVNVVAYRITTDTTILAFGLTNHQGYYRLYVPASVQPLLMAAKALGYATQYFSLPTPLAPAGFTHQFALTVRAIALNEVLIKPVSDIAVNRDTTTYQAKAFADGSERSVEDLIRKLPGMVVSDDGKLTINGKPVDKVLIEGEELFGKKYQLITRNMSAGLLYQVQAIDHYQDNPLLREVDGSGKTVLNLVVNPEARGRPFGNVSAAGGPQTRYETNTALFSLLGVVKVGLITNANNLGNDPIAQMPYELESESASALSEVERPNAQPLLQNRQAVVPDLAQQRYNFNQARLVGLSLNIRPTSKITTRSYLYVTRDWHRSGSVASQQYILNDSTVFVSDSLNSAQLPISASGQLLANYSIDSTQGLRLTSTIKLYQSVYSAHLNTQNKILPEQIGISGSEQMRSGQHQLQYTRKLLNRQAFIALFTYQTATLPQTTLWDSKRYAPLFSQPDSFRIANQRITQTD